MSGSFDREDLHAPMADINTTPLVDVLLVLLVIFLVTAPMLQGAIKVELPTEKVSVIDSKESLVISIDEAGNYYLNETAFTFEDLSRHLTDIAKEDPKQPISIRADGKAAYNKISHLLAQTANAGLVDIRFITKVE